MKTSVRNIISGLFLGTAIFTVQAETITTGSVLNANNQEVITYTVNHITCANANNGSIDINIENGSTYYFSWDNGSNQEDQSNLSSGVYRVKIETNEGEIIWASFEVTAPEALEGMISQTDLHSSVNLDLTVQGGTAPYTYNWSTGESNEDVFGLSTEGIYEVNVTDANGCQLNLGTYVSLESASIEEVESSFTVYPNPNNGNGTITWNNAEVTEITIMNAAGQIVTTQEVNNTTSATFNGLTPGMYVAKIQSAQNAQTLQFIVQ